MITVEIDTRQLTRNLDRFARTQVPFAAARTLNAVALDFQQDERRHLRRAFILRRPEFVERQGVKVKGGFARKDRLSVTVGVDSKADFLERYESQTIKRPREGRSLAVPQQVRRNKKDIVPKGQRPKALKANKKVFAVRDQGESMRTAHLKPGLYQRMGGKRNPRLRLLYAFERAVRIRPVLRYVETARRIAAERFPRHWHREFAAALRAAR